MIQPSVFSLRSPIAVIAAAALGILVAATGYLVQKSAEAARIEAQDTARSDAADTRLTLARTLLKHSLVTSAQRLEELANLPLLAEFLDLAATDPKGGDTAELKAYLDEALKAASQSPDIAALIALSASGEALLAIGEIAGEQPKPDPGKTILVVSTPEGETAALWLQAEIPPLDGGAGSAGFLIAQMPDDILQSLKAAQVAVSLARQDAGATPAEGIAGSRLGPLVLSVAPTPALSQPHSVPSAPYWLFAGICVFLAGLAGLAARRSGQRAE
ncbi:hypothetical protein [Breoghania sp.]|uniref:hypothetical protein n=1 Tax=Breoghania sp. TaxID=2065378 RepID=UPI002AA6DD21|nr:hypothetical protein [Breoghania sp.]